MKTKSIIAALLLVASSAFAQVPSYVPTNGLVGWWPFNGNANDESGNGNNATANGATLDLDRFGNTNSSYRLYGSTGIIRTNNPFYYSNTNHSISFWIKIQDPTDPDQSFYNTVPHTIECFGFNYYLNPAGYFHYFLGNGVNGISGWNTALNQSFSAQSCLLATTSWFNYTIVLQGLQWKLYINGNLCHTFNANQATGSMAADLCFGNDIASPSAINGQIDDIGTWNRALTQQEITALYTAQSCTSNTITADGPTTFCAGNYVNLTSDVVGGTYQWKKNGVNISTNGTSRTYKATATGSYTCVATCNGTALTSNAIQVTSQTNAAVTLTASGATSFCAGDSVTLNATNLGSNYSVQWYRTNVSMENATNYSQVVKQPGTYKVVTRNLTNGCSRISGSSVVVAVNCRLANPDVISAELVSTDLDTKIAGEDPKGKIYIYPNPTSDNKFTVELMGLELNGNATLEVYNAMGQILSSEKVNITNGALNRTIQIDEQSIGQLCIVRLIIGSEAYDSKVILK